MNYNFESMCYIPFQDHICIVNHYKIFLAQQISHFHKQISQLEYKKLLFDQNRYLKFLSSGVTRLQLRPSFD